jgi:hypothetical protein
MGLLYGRAGRLTAQNGGFRPGQFRAMQLLVLTYAVNTVLLKHSFQQLGQPTGACSHGPRGIFLQAARLYTDNP